MEYINSKEIILTLISCKSIRAKTLVNYRCFLISFFTVLQSIATDLKKLEERKKKEKWRMKRRLEHRYWRAKLRRRPVAGIQLRGNRIYVTRRTRETIETTIGDIRWFSHLAGSPVSRPRARVYVKEFTWLAEAAESRGERESLENRRHSIYSVFRN